MMSREAFRLDRRLTLRELGLAWASLAVLAGLAFAPLVLHGGFHLDDWSNAAGALYPPGGRSISHTLTWYKEFTLFRPVLILYVPLTYVVFGMHQHFLLAWSVFLAWTAVCLLYGVLRKLGVPWIHSLVIAGLVLVFPWFDCTRLWVSGALISLAISFMLGGFWIALVGLERRDARMHWIAVVLYLLAMLTYELTLPVVAFLGAIYFLRSGWREARWRWAVDLVAVVASGIWVLSHTVRTKSGVSGDLSHLKQIVEGGGTILGRSVLPTGTQQTTIALVALAVVLGVGLVVWLRGPSLVRTSSSGWGLREWLMLAGAGVALAVLGWAVFIPADPYYTPTIYGLTNRVNGLAGFGTVITVYAALGVVGTLVGPVIRRVRLAPIGITLGLAALLGLGYVTVLHRHIGIWNSAYVAEEKALTQVASRYPNLPDGSVIFAGNYPAYQTLGVPILSATWDFDGMVKDHYETYEVSAYPLLEGWSLHCRPEGVALESEGIVLRAAPYGAARLMNLEAETAYHPRDQRSCEKVVGNLAPGPMYLSYAY
jgi:hypothetical protein